MEQALVAQLIVDGHLARLTETSGRSVFIVRAAHQPTIICEETPLGHATQTNRVQVATDVRSTTRNWMGRAAARSPST